MASRSIRVVLTRQYKELHVSLGGPGDALHPGRLTELWKYSNNYTQSPYSYTLILVSTITYKLNNSILYNYLVVPNVLANLVFFFFMRGEQSIVPKLGYRIQQLSGYRCGTFSLRGYKNGPGTEHCVRARSHYPAGPVRNIVFRPDLGVSFSATIGNGQLSGYTRGTFTKWLICVLPFFSASQEIFYLLVM